MNDLSWRARQAHILSQAHQHGYMTADELVKWKLELIQPTGFWAKFSWKVFGI